MLPNDPGPMSRQHRHKQPGPPPAAPAATVTVRRGDTLWSLATHRLGPGATPARIAAEWHRWYAANRATIGSDPDRITTGTTLVVPAAAPEAGDR